ncbi:hypothetical protein GYMLUDRAFT_251603 [Collybiopsis luxurians FD-317 M1]|uniref:Uncharacterized protein n=1 Tax=Collybiopsis luxurians FD-317 M1 TaxID=944289 RepID=A0A0D0C251_9AGAR|nr:hypothetical protein GYMLUDRAFT_251603 [Collybiopsis luxurians FD-317 M1]
MPLLVTLEASDEALPKDWLQKCSDAIAQLSIKLASAQESARNMKDTHISFAEPVIHVKSGEEGKEESPHDKRLLGMLKHGIYKEDDCQGIDLELIKDFYGTTDRLPPRPPGHTGAGYLGDDEPDSDRNSSDEGNELDLDDLS